MHGDGEKSVRFRNRLAAHYFLAFSNNGNCRLAEMLTQGHNQYRRKRKLADYQLAGIVLVLGWMHPVPERILMYYVQHLFLVQTAS